MVDYVERTSTGLFGNIGKSIKGVLTGLLMFLASFAVLWWNEGRTDMSAVAKRSVAAPADKVDPALDGKFVSATAPLLSDARLEDPDYLYPVEALTLFRNVEMYAWVEKKETREEKKIGGGSETITTYSYVREWTGNPADSNGFRDPEARRKGYVNPSLTVSSQSWTAEKATIGAYGFSPREAAMPSAERLRLTAEMLRIPDLATEAGAVATASPQKPRLEGDYLFLGMGSLSSPQIGDVRISFSALKPGAKVTIFGKQSGTGLETYTHDTGDTLLRVLTGTRDEALAQMAFEHKMMSWILRGVGFLMMWFGLCLFFGPINAVLDILPFLGSAGRTIVSIAMFPIALVLSLVTIVVSKIAHNPIALVVTLAVIIGGTIFWARSRKK